MNLLQKYEKKIESLSSLDGVYALRIFGSELTGKRGINSDLDLCFFVNPEKKETILKIKNQKSKTFDPSIFHRLPLSVQEEVMRKGKVFLVKDEKRYRDQKKIFVKEYRNENRLLKRLIEKRYGVKV